MVKGLADGNRPWILVALTEHNGLSVCPLIKMLGLAGATVSRLMNIPQGAVLSKTVSRGGGFFIVSLVNFLNCSKRGFGNHWPIHQKPWRAGTT